MFANYKNVLSLAAAAAFAASVGTVAFAAEPVSTNDDQASVTIVNRSRTITPQAIDELKESVGATLSYDDGTEIPVDTVVTIEDASPLVLRTNGSEGRSYRVAVDAEVDHKPEENNNARKVVANSGYRNNEHVNASATLQLVWTDGPGLNNAIEEVSGTLDVRKGTVQSAQVRYGNWLSSATNWVHKNVGASRSFRFTQHIAVPSPACDYGIFFANDSAQLYIKASSNIIQ